MRFKLAAIIALACLPMAAQARVTGALVAQGSIATVSGVAHIMRGGEGTYITLDNPGAARSVGGFIAFGDEPTFPGLEALNGRNVEISGVVVLDGGATIILANLAGCPLDCDDFKAVSGKVRREAGAAAVALKSPWRYRANCLRLPGRCALRI